MKTKGNTILITGGTSGIGLGLAEQFFSNSNKVILCGRRSDRLEKIGKDHPGIILKQADLALEADRKALCDWVLKEYPSINMLVNNAGIQLTADLTQPVDLERIRAEVEINLVAPIHMSSLLAPALARQSEAAIVNISSGLAFVPLAFMPVYCATKAAIHSLSLSMRYQFRKTGIRVFEIIPPSVDTELGHDRRSDKSQTHGGLSVAQFTPEVIKAIAEDRLEASVGDARHLREQGENWFGRLNR